MPIDKTFISNLAISKTKAGVQDTGLEYVSSIAASVFADYSTGTNNTIKRIALYYETCLKRCLREIVPDFAKRFADLGNRITINQETAEWSYLFELPTDYLAFVRQTYEGNHKLEIEAVIRDFTAYAHTVTGSDDLVYICSVSHTSATATKPITGANYGSYWTEDTSEEYSGADWEAGKAYTADTDGKLLLTNSVSNLDGDSAYIEYIPYVQAGINDDPSKYTDEFQHALATLLASEIELDFDRRQALLMEYYRVAMPKAKEEERRTKYIKKYPTVINQRTNLRVGK